jgi:hypothetical protein
MANIILQHFDGELRELDKLSIDLEHKSYDVNKPNFEIGTLPNLNKIENIFKDLK